MPDPQTAPSRGRSGLLGALALIAAGVALFWISDGASPPSTPGIQTLALGERLGSLEMLDEDDRPATLTFEDAPPVTIIWFWSNLCSCVSECEARIRALLARYQDRPVRFIALDPHPHDTREEIEALRRALESPYPVWRDPTARSIVRLGIETSASVAVLDGEGRLRFRGAIDDDLDAPTVSWVNRAVDALLAGTAVETPAAPFYGCRYPIDLE